MKLDPGQTTKLEVFRDHEDRGWIGGQKSWWSDPKFPQAFQIFDLDSFYEEGYFREDHVDEVTVKKLADQMLRYGELILKKPARSLLELGCGGGWFTEELIGRGVEVVAVEGSKVGYEKTVERVPKAKKRQVLKWDLRRPLDLGKQFDMVVCTEVAEHIEPPFASQLVENAVRHSRVVWFSFAEPGNQESHYHHSNEQPVKYWQNLFKFYGYEMVVLPEKTIIELQSRGKCIFVARQIKLPRQLVRKLENEQLESKGGRKMAKRLIVKLIPPIVLEVYLKLKSKWRQ